MSNEFTKKSEPSYYNMVKGEFLPLIPIGPNVILDLGCGTGQLGRKLNETNKTHEVVGVEICAQAAEEASKYYNKVYQGNVESLSLPYTEYFDFVICGDILEHLIDPWTMLIKINNMLKSGGTLICSIPNIRYFKIISELLLNGTWAYTEAGILDSTHLRFFTKKTFFKMLGDANYSVKWCYLSIHGKKKMANMATFGIFSEFLATQIMVAAKKA
jgi:2-polyprenyl-3-methyl-5-hydroxy-6-metoxy-1,4-benzoquinol methylase